MPQAGVAVSRDEPGNGVGGDAAGRGTLDGAVPPPRGAVPGRRTVTIQGRGGDRPPAETGRARGAARTRPMRRPHERAGFRPDRVAMWAVLLGVLLVLAAATSSHATVRHVQTSRPIAGADAAWMTERSAVCCHASPG